MKKEKEVIKMNKEEVRAIERHYQVCSLIMVAIAILLGIYSSITYEPKSIGEIIALILALLSAISGLVLSGSSLFIAHNQFKYINKWSSKKYEIID